MKRLLLSSLSLVVLLGGAASCKKATATGEGTSQATGETLSAESFHEAADPVNAEMEAFRTETRQAYNHRQFEALEKTAAALRASKAVFGNGSWKIVQFHTSLECRKDEPEGMWQLHDEIRRAWIAAYPQSATAKVAYGNFLTDYAWHARGSGYANTVTEEGWQLMKERVETARKVLYEARRMPDYDPFYGVAMLTVALGQDWPAVGYDFLLAELTKKEPTFWGYQTARAYALLPRWSGEPGDWEKYADQCAAAPGGLGAEVYARIVMNQTGFYENVFSETHASWPKTRDGFEILRKKYPNSLEILNLAAALATRAQDKAFAKAMLEQMGTGYLPSMWHGGGQVAAARAWAGSQ